MHTWSRSSVTQILCFETYDSHLSMRCAASMTNVDAGKVHQKLIGSFKVEMRSMLDKEPAADIFDLPLTLPFSWERQFNADYCRLTGPTTSVQITEQPPGSMIAAFRKMRSKVIVEFDREVSLYRT